MSYSASYRKSACRLRKIERCCWGMDALRLKRVGSALRNTFHLFSSAHPKGWTLSVIMSGCPFQDDTIFSLLLATTKCLSEIMFRLLICYIHIDFLSIFLSLVNVKCLDSREFIFTSTLIQ